MPSLKNYPTTGLATDTLAVITIGNEEQMWRLDSGAAAFDPSHPTQLPPADYNVISNDKHWQLVSSVPVGGGTVGAGGGDISPLAIGQPFVDVTFEVVQTSPDWEFIDLQIINTIDPLPLNIWPGIATAKSTTGFTLQLNGAPDSSNYYLHWSFNGVGGAFIPSNTYLLIGPASGPISAPSTPFTVHLPTGGMVMSPVTITPHDGGAGGSFSPSTVVLTTASPSANFTYTPVSYG